MIAATCFGLNYANPDFLCTFDSAANKVTCLGAKTSYAVVFVDDTHGDAQELTTPNGGAVRITKTANGVFELAWLYGAGEVGTCYVNGNVAKLCVFAPALPG